MIAGATKQKIKKDKINNNNNNSNIVTHAKLYPQTPDFTTPRLKQLCAAF